MGNWISWQNHCPSCGESCGLLLDPGFTGTSLVYSEDCQMCNRPIVVALHVDEYGNCNCQLNMGSDS